MKEETKKTAVAFIGEPLVGKTELIRLLTIREENTKNKTTLKTENAVFDFWEFQTSSINPEKLEIFARSFLQESKPFHRYLLIVSDSSMEDINQIKYALNYLRKLFTDTRLAIIANKQDLESSLPKSRIEKMVKLPTLEISTKDPQNRSRLVNFLSYLIGFDTGL
jgi:signal recognition particle receptor subunit beta